jgi:hypothetical protein
MKSGEDYPRVRLRVLENNELIVIHAVLNGCGQEAARQAHRSQCHYDRVIFTVQLLYGCDSCISWKISPTISHGVAGISCWTITSR